MHSFEMCKGATSVCQDKAIIESDFVAKKKTKFLSNTNRTEPGD